MLAWLRRLRRARLRARPFPEAWSRYLRARVPHYRLLSPEEQARLRGDVRVLAAEKYWEGCGGLEMTDEIRVTIAAQACLLTLNLPDRTYPRVRSILVYPAGYIAPERRTGPAGVVTVGRSHRLGEAWRDGPVVLSWEDALAGGTDPADGSNVVLHEFAHQLDMEDGRADGVPLLPDHAAWERWVRVMESEYAVLAEQAARGARHVLDPYGAESPAELFSVATEAFFERARALRAGRPELYSLLRDFYRQDPAARLDARAERLRPPRRGPHAASGEPSCPTEE